MVTPYLRELIEELSTENDVDYLSILSKGFNEQAAVTFEDHLKGDLESAAREVDKRIKALRQ